MSKGYTYQELCKPIGSDAEYPDRCPVCNAGVKDESQTDYRGPIYECGGQYTYKPQIQNHTDKWWGKCPKAYEKGLDETSLTDTESVVWCVKENGTRLHIASFSMSFLSESFAKEFSESYPRFWNDESPVAYIEVLGSLSGYSGVRYKNGKRIAMKGIPYHLKKRNLDINCGERVWYEILNDEGYTYKMGGLV